MRFNYSAATFSFLAFEISMFSLQELAIWTCTDSHETYHTFSQYYLLISAWTESFHQCLGRPSNGSCWDIPITHFECVKSTTCSTCTGKRIFVWLLHTLIIFRETYKLLNVCFKEYSGFRAWYCSPLFRLFGKHLHHLILSTLSLIFVYRWRNFRFIWSRLFLIK